MTTELPGGEVPNSSYNHVWEPGYEHVIIAMALLCTYSACFGYYADRTL